MSTKQDTINKFRVRLVPDGECLVWSGAKNHGGYGMFSDGKKLGERLTHRIAWTLAAKRPIPANAVVRHTCHNRACCNPQHLVVGTHRDNMRDMREAGRSGGEIVPDADLREILRASQAGVAQKDIARAFGVTRSFVSNAVAWFYRLEAAGLASMK